MNPYTLIAGLPDRSRPAVTHYAGAGARVELSGASLANAVAKAAGLLRDEVGVAPGARISVDLPLHWQLPVWALAALAVGGRVGRRDAEDVAVRIVGPGHPALQPGTAGPVAWGAADLLVSSCDAFGMPLRGAVPAGALDVGIEARAQPDVFSPEPGVERDAALRIGGRWSPWDALVPAGASSRGGPRAWLAEGDVPDERLLLAAIQPLLGQGSIVLAIGVSDEVAQRLRLVEGASL